MTGVEQWLLPKIGIKPPALDLHQQTRPHA
jgi:hypothetical protein